MSIELSATMNFEDDGNVSAAVTLSFITKDQAYAFLALAEDFKKKALDEKAGKTKPKKKTAAKTVKEVAEEPAAAAEVKTETYESSEGRVILRFDINEGHKVQVKKIIFHGNAFFSDKKLRKQMKEIKEDRWWRGADFDKEKYAEDY